MLTLEYRDMLVKDWSDLSNFYNTFFHTWFFRSAPFVCGEDISEEEARGFDKAIAEIQKGAAELSKEVRAKIRLKPRPSTRKENQIIEDRFLTDEKFNERAYVKHYLAGLDEISRNIGRTVNEIQRGLELGIDDVDSPLTHVLLSTSMVGYALMQHAHRMRGQNPDKDLMHIVTEYGHAGACFAGLRHVGILHNVYALDMHQLKKCIRVEEDPVLLEEEKNKPKRWYSIRELHGVMPFRGIDPWRVAYDKDSLIPPSYVYLLPPEVKEMLEEFNNTWGEIYGVNTSNILRTDPKEWGKNPSKKKKNAGSA